MQTVLCLHASASCHRQWQTLADELGPDVRLLAPDLIGYGNAASARGQRISLDAEVDNIIEQVGVPAEPVHVVGHSYGGGVALKFAERYPDKVASLTLYEPAQPLALFEDGLHSSEARELRRLRELLLTQASTTFGRWRAARDFINYWSGSDSWSKLAFSGRRKLVSKMPKIIAEWNAMFSASAALTDVSRLTMPVRIMVGSRSRRTAKRVAEILCEQLPNAVLDVIHGLGHLGPLTDPARVNARIAGFVGTARMPLRNAA